MFHALRSGSEQQARRVSIACALSDLRESGAEGGGLDVAPVQRAAVEDERLRRQDRLALQDSEPAEASAGS